MLKLPAPAKINLHLTVTGKTINGYHTLDTSFTYVDVGDTLRIENADNLHVTCSDPGLNTRNNLVFRVLDAMRNSFDITQGIKVHIEKNLPVQAGLGGGSSDAATAIIAANALWSLNLDSRTLIEFATPFGADIPCFLFGHASRATGVGERLEHLDPGIEGAHLVLAHPGIGLSTADVFSSYDKVSGTGALQLTPSSAGDTIRAGFTGDGDVRFALGENALENVACGMCPELATLLEAMRNQTKCAWMSGSGTACVALAENAADARKLARRLEREELAAWTHAGRVLSCHPLHETGPKPKDWGVAKR
ncbi:MAG: 4-(cytidine 5'-diphospho)-2-C-methyl-D-erythritol kinase [Zetaproteobacteria bacterium]|nr:MAG: 4-(cytidine 5'-diphospho)-2-C-methyl-D-erythritol kinase [Zetaproteobacteria bacterium]